MVHIRKIYEMATTSLYAGNGAGGKITYNHELNYSPDEYIPKLFRTKAAYKKYEGFLQIAADELGFDLTITPAPYLGRGKYIKIKGEHFSAGSAKDGEFELFWGTNNKVPVSTYLRNEMNVDGTNYPIVHELADEYQKRYEGVSESQVNEALRRGNGDDYRFFIVSQKEADALVEEYGSVEAIPNDVFIKEAEDEGTVYNIDDFAAAYNNMDLPTIGYSVLRILPKIVYSKVTNYLGESKVALTAAERGQSDALVRRELKQWAESTCDWLATQKEGCRWYNLGSSNTKTGTMAIVMGWENGFDNDADENPNANGSWRICTKLAYNCDDLQCDYGVDWEMPYDEATGNVDDTDGEYFSVEDVYCLYDKWKNEYKA